MTAIDNARAVLADPYGVSHRETIKALSRLVAEYERLTAMHSGESHPEEIYSPEVFAGMNTYLARAEGSPMRALRLAVSASSTSVQADRGTR